MSATSDRLDFLSPGLARAENGFEPRLTSPMARAFADGAPSGIEDVSLSTGKIELRGDVTELDADGFELVRITPRRALVLCAFDDVEALGEKLREQFLAIDVTAALAGLRIERPDAVTLVRRLTDLDLDDLPAVGAIVQMQALVIRDGEAEFRLFFPQEDAYSVAEVVFDAAAGLDGVPARIHGGVA